MDPIRKAELKDVSRIAEILIFTKRTQYPVSYTHLTLPTILLV